MIVKFQNTFHAPGFGRRRFLKGVVRDVPEAFRAEGMLPTSAKILPDSHHEEETPKQQDERLAADMARANLEGTGQAALEKAGMAGFVDQDTPVITPEEQAALDDELAKALAEAHAATQRADEADARAEGAQVRAEEAEGLLAEADASAAQDTSTDEEKPNRGQGKK